MAPANAPGASDRARRYVGGERDIGEYLLSSRSFEEYRSIFSMSDEDFGLRILDCPGGGSSFTATVNAIGGDATAVDPVYALPPVEVAEMVAAEVARGSAWAIANMDRYRWDFYGDPAGHRRVRTESARSLGADIVANPARYRPGALPELPFPDNAFDLVLCSHLLFTYSDRLDLEFHRSAIVEMARVGTQVRIYPLVHQSGTSERELLADLIAMLPAHGLQARPVRVSYEFQQGANEMLVISREV
jgi:SAM-dependent methyltransferase